jgi:hypothetical protein
LSDTQGEEKIMTLSISKTKIIYTEERKEIERKRDYYSEKDRPYLFDRWMKRHYGYADYILTGDNGMYTLNLGKYVK